MFTIDEITTQIVIREGGFVDDPDDAGGATKYGVTIGTLRSLGIDLDKDGDVDVSDVKLISVALASEIFKKHYFFRPRINILPLPLQPAVYDMQANSGNNAVKILQRLLNEYGKNLVVDGDLGSKTEIACNQVYDQIGQDLVDQYSIRRRSWYYDLAERVPTNRKYVVTRSGGKGGWITRAEEFLDKDLRLTSKQHKAIVAAWR